MCNAIQALLGHVCKTDLNYNIILDLSTKMAEGANIGQEEQDENMHMDTKYSLNKILECHIFLFSS